MLQYSFDLSQKVWVEKRKVLSITSVFGELGGLYGSLASIAYFLIGNYQQGSADVYRLSSLFKVPVLSTPKAEVRI